MHRSPRTVEAKNHEVKVDSIDVDSGEIIALYASGERSLARALTFLRRVLKACDGKPIIVVSSGP